MQLVTSKYVKICKCKNVLFYLEYYNETCLFLIKFKKSEYNKLNMYLHKTFNLLIQKSNF